MIKGVSILAIIIVTIMICIELIQKRKEKKEETTKLGEWIEKNSKILFTILLVIGILARVIGIADIPRGLHIDEAGMAYDSYCLFHYGTDRYDNSFPLYFTNFGQGQSALCTYLVSLSVGILGLNSFAIRMPIAIISILAMIVMYLLVKELKNKRLGLLVLFLIAICPWHIMQARWSLDCNLLSSFLIFSMFAFYKAKKPIGYIGAGILIGITLYTYVLSYIIVPIFLTCSILYLWYLKKIHIKQMICLGIPIFLLALPLLYMVLLNNKMVPRIEFPLFSIPELPAYRIGEIGLKNIKENLNLPFILFLGDDMMYNVPNEFGTLYYISIPFFAIGLCLAIKKTILSIKEKKFHFDAIMLFQFIAVCICMLLIVEPKVNKANAIFIPMLYFTALGIQYFSKSSASFFLILLLFYLIHFGMFETYYFTEFKNNQDVIYDAYFNDSLKDLTKYIEEQEKFRNKRVHFELRPSNSIYFYRKEPYIYTLFANQMSPKEFSSSMTVGSDKVLNGYGRYSFYRIKEYRGDTIYVLDHLSKEIIEALENRKFKLETKDNYFIYYQE